MWNFTYRQLLLWDSPSTLAKPEQNGLHSESSCTYSSHSHFPFHITIHASWSERPSFLFFFLPHSSFDDIFPNKSFAHQLSDLNVSWLFKIVPGPHLKKWIQRGLVEVIFNKLQEVERERREHYVLEVSTLVKEIIEVGPDTEEMLNLLDCGNLSNMLVTQHTVVMNFRISHRSIWDFLLCCNISINHGQQKQLIKQQQ